MDISTITDLTTLESMAYKEIIKRDTAQQNLEMLNRQISAVVAAAVTTPHPKDLGVLPASESEPTGDADADSTTTTTTVAE